MKNNLNETIIGAAAAAPQNFERSQEEISAASNQQKMMEAIARYKAAHTPKVREHKIARNDKCPCGSGLKYKNCCLKTGKYENYTMKKQ